MQEIQQLAVQIDYRKVTGKKRGDAINILVLSQISNLELDSDYLDGVSRASIGANVTVHFFHCHADECASLFDPLRVPRLLSSGLLDGILLFDKWPMHVVERLQTYCPVVSIMHEYDGVDTIALDEGPAMLQIADHLIEGNCKRIGFFGACPDLSWTSSRLAAFAGALCLRGLPLRDELIIQVPVSEALRERSFYFHEGMTKARRLSSQNVDGWVCPSHAIAISLRQYLERVRFLIPHDVCLTGFHSAPPHQVAQGSGALTTTTVAPFAIGETALEQLVRRILGWDGSRVRILVPCILSQGGTTRLTGTHTPQSAASSVALHAGA